VLELKTVNFIFVSFIFFILNLDKECNVTSCITITQVTKCDGGMISVTMLSHILLSQVTQSHDAKKNIESSGTDDVI